MKKTLLLMLILSTFFPGKSQTNENLGQESPGFFLGTSTGIDNYSGIIGLGVEGRLASRLTGRAGFGIGSWGSKFTVAGLYQNKEKMNWGYGAGLSFASGIKDLDLDLKTSAGTRTVNLDLHRAKSLNFFASRSWIFRNGKNKFMLDLGYAFALDNVTFYSVNDDTTLSSDEELILRIIKPGGLIVGAGIMFGL